MSKELTEQLPSTSEVKKSDGAFKKVHFSSLNQKGAIPFIICELNKIFLQREQPIEEVFTHFLDTISNQNS